MNFRFWPAILLVFATTSWAQTSSEDDAAQLPLDDLRTFTKVYYQIRSTYVEEISDRELLEYAIKGMLSELDPHSNYLDASSFDDLQVNTTGEFGGLGIEVGMENGFVKVISPIDDTPASRAGLQAGDLIITLDGKPVKGMSLNDAIELMRGPVGSEIDITVVRDGVDQPFDVTLVRDTIKVRSVRSRMLEPGYAYLRIAQFQLKTGEDMVDELNKLKAKNPNLKGVVLDLRNNPGGILQASVKVADAFLEDGLVVYTKGRVENADVEYRATPGDEINGMPLVVLINGGSASASEIVAGALQDHGRAVIMGTDSFGKGSVQTVIPISEDRAIKLTTALYFTPNGRSIQAQGIVPDITVERAQITNLETPEALTEADLRGRLDNANGGEARDAKTRERINHDTPDLATRDNQLYEALNLLKGITIFAKRDNSTSSTQMADNSTQQ
ncbi:S41 family peptidase [Halioxenophilus sp. WMMB6]|uniref:S41 family peptidase n=1 Tax=Halioxenophilus sp. WMMB6 TaxID=3073815 RepID=UPI00295E6413|nr:S41 family peptidase [Halioxenophilus sp. WMMB6]